MAPRSVPWRRTSSEICCWHQSQAMDSTIYILRNTGPTGFLLKEEGERKTVKVFLGDPHTCTCSTYKKERDLCKHICWLLLRKFRLSVNDPLAWQLGLVEMEINEILRGRVTAEQRRTRPDVKEKKEIQSQDGKTMVQQRDIADEDVCPICQDEFLAKDKKLPVTYCKFGCGNSVHIKCMKVWAEHQQKTHSDGSIKCPMCREDFGPIELLKTEMRNAGGAIEAPPGIRMDRHIGIACGHCSKAPIEGKCYRCTFCPTFYMCQRCFNLPVHTNHQFQFRQKRNQRWRDAVRTLGSSLPPALVNELQTREISENDYDLLQQLDRSTEGELSNLTEESLSSLPLEAVRTNSSLLAPGSQCRVCLRGFSVGQYVRKLPCKHKFHKDCIDSWLLHSHPNCPIDGIVVLSRTVHGASQGGGSQRSDPGPQSSSTNISNNLSIQGDASSLSVQGGTGLVLSAMGVPMSASRLPGGTRGRRLPHQRHTTGAEHTVHRADLQLHLSGTRLHENGEDIMSAAVAATDQTSVPGRRLLQHASLQRDRLTRLQAEGGEEGEQLTPADLIQFLASGSSPFAGQDILIGHASESGSLGTRGNSAGSAISMASDPAGRGRVRGTAVRARQAAVNLRRRAGSLDRGGVASISGVRQGSRDLYLGNNPQNQAATSEQAMMAAQVTSQPQRMRTRPPPRPTPQRRPPVGMEAGGRREDFSLQGNGLDSHADPHD